MRALAVLAVMMLAGVAALVHRHVTRPRSADEAYREAERLFQSGDYAGASKACERAIRWSPNHASSRALFMEVQFILGQGKALPVAACYDKYMTRCGSRVELIAEMDEALGRAERGDDSEKNARRVLEYAKWVPESPELRARVEKANALLASEGSASPAEPSRLPSP